MDSYLGKYWSNKEQARRALYAAFGINIVGTGDIYLVKKSDDDDYNEWLRMMPSANVVTTITKAVAACTSGRGDIIVVSPGTYTEAVALNKNDVKIVGLGATPHATLIDGDGSIAITITGVDCKLENLHIKTSGAAIVCVYGTGLVGGPMIDNCDFTQIELTSKACVEIAGATTRGVRVTNCNFLGANSGADALNLTGKQAFIYGNTSEDLNTTEGTCFGSTSYHTGSNNLAV